MNITCISDTHRGRPSLPGGDLLLYAGDDDIITENDLTEYVDENYVRYDKEIINVTL